MSKEETIIILKYAYFMSRVIAPISARKVGLYNIDGAVCDFYRELVCALEKDEEINIQKDDFLSLVYKDMVEDIDNRDIEYDGMIFSTKSKEEDLERDY